MSLTDYSLVVEMIPKGKRIVLFASGEPLRTNDYLSLLEGDVPFADWYTAQLRRLSSTAVFWEHPVMRLDAAATAAEFVLLDAPALAGVQPDHAAFAEHLSAETALVRVFDSLGRDARLIAPVPSSDKADFAHLAVFLRQASLAQTRALWSAVACATKVALRRHPVWLSTSGLGVPWLHVRVDRQPKYYQHRPYVSGDPSLTPPPPR